MNISSTSSRELPNEILIKIFDLAPPKSVFQCVLVCKAWSMAALQTYYKHLCLTGDMINLLQAAFSLSAKNKRPIMTIGQNGEYVRSLTFDSDSKQNEKFNKSQLVTLLSNMPYLKKIDLSSSRRTMHYVNYLWDILVKKPTSRRHQDRVSLKGMVKEIGVSSVDHLTKKKYLQVCYALRDSLTHLCIGRLKQVGADDQDRSLAFIRLLPQFKNLTHILLNNTTCYRPNTGALGLHWLEGIGGSRQGSYNPESNISIQSVLNACSKLTHLKLISSKSVIHDMVDKSASFDMILIAADSGKNSFSSSSSNYYYGVKCRHEHDRLYNNDSNGRMKVAQLRVPNLNIRNLIDYISSRASTVKVVLYKQPFDLWIQDCDGAKKENLMRELDEAYCTIKDLDLKFQGITGSLLTSVDQAFLKRITLEDRIVAFEKFVGMVARSNDDLLCDMELDFYDDVNEDKEARELVLTIKDGVMYIKYGFRLKDDDYMVLPSILGASDTSAADNNCKMQLSSKLYSVKINIKKKNAMDDNKEKQLIAAELMQRMATSLIQNCERLAYVSIKYGQYYQSSSYYGANGDGGFYVLSTIKDYTFSSELYGCSLPLQKKDSGGGIIPTKKYQQLMNRPSTKEGLSDIMMGGFSLSPGATVSLSSNTLNHIKSIKLEECNFAKDESDNNVYLDLSNIQRLETLELDASKLELSSYQHVFFLVKCVNERDEETKKAYYQCHEKTVKSSSRYSSKKRLSLVPTTYKYIHSRGRFTSMNSLAIIITFSGINSVTIYHSGNEDDNNAKARITFGDSATAGQQ